MTGPRIVLVVAEAENGVIGRDGALPWRLPSDLRVFRRMTMGKPVVMGRRTFQSLGKPLKGRDNIVVSRDAAFSADGLVVVRSLDEALTLARNCAARCGAEEIAVIGGAQIYRQALPLAERIYLSRVHASPPGDTVFPALAAGDWREVSREFHSAGPEDSADFSFIVLERVR